MSNFGSTEWYQRVKQGLVPKHSIVGKFGATQLNTTIRPATQTGFYRTPTAAVSLEIYSTDAADGVGGSGARTVTVIGLDSSWNEVTQDIIMNGVTPVAIPTPLTRLYRMYVTTSGTYSSATTASSHVGDIFVRVSGGGETWAMIENSPTAMGQSQIGIYTIPIGYTAYLLEKAIFVDTSKPASLFFFYRDNCDDVTVPYTGVRRLIEREIGIAGGFSRKFTAPRGPYIGPCDIGFMGSVTAGTADCSVEFELLLIQD
jgi:hypothetical protein